MREQRVLTFRGEESKAVIFDMVLSVDQAWEMQAVAQERASLGGAAGHGKGMMLYADPRSSKGGTDYHPTFASWPANMHGRYDVGFTTLAHGGRFNRQRLMKKGGQFRDTFAYGDGGHKGVQALLQHEGFKEAARALYEGQRPLIEPQMMFANLMLPGELQGIHTDVPEFRGVNRKNTPEWVLVAMHHSGLFKRWHMRIATAVSWFSHHSGGELAYYADPEEPGIAHPSEFNTSIMVDTDSVYHGVDPVGPADTLPPMLPGKPSYTLVHKGGGRFCVQDAQGQVVPPYLDLGWDKLRMSVQWKAYCFSDEQERQVWLQHTDDLSPDVAFQELVDAAVRHGAARGDEPIRELGAKLVKHFIRVPRELRQVHQPIPLPAAAAKL